MDAAGGLLNFSGRKKLPLVLQAEMAECGLACLAMISGFHGHPCDLISLRSKHAIPLTGATLKSVVSIADRMNLLARPVKADLHELRHVKMPAILHWNMKHFVVLREISTHRAVIHDPSQGVRELDAEAFSKHYTGVAVELTPTKDFTHEDERVRVSLRDFWTRIQGLGGSLGQILILSIALQVFALASPLFMQLVVDEAVLSHDENLLGALAVGFGLLMLLEAATQAIRSFVILVLGNSLSMQLGSNLFRHLIYLPLRYFQSRHIGDTVSRFGSLEDIRELLTTGFVTAMVDGLMSLAMVVMLLVYSPMLAGVVLAVVLLYLTTRLVFFRPLRELTEETISARAAEQSNFIETIRGVQTIKAFGSELERQTLWQNRFAQQINSSIRLGRYTIGFELASGVLFGLGSILVVYLGATEILSGSLTIGMLYAFVAYKARFIQNAQSLIEKAVEFKMVKLHLERLADIVKTPAESSSVAPLLDEERFEGRLTLRNVAFRYAQGDEFIFNDVNLTIEPGESFAIVGASGCGKTTLIKVMVGLFQPSKGKVLMDDVDVNAAGRKLFRQHVGMVMQEDKLFSGSIADNIAFFDPSADQKQVERCAKLAAIHDDVLSMPMRYNTLVGDMGTTLSGGQKQRVLLARALYRKPRILFLDEATSHLDQRNEAIVNENIAQLRTTRIVIAHRESTIQSADRVLSMFSGKLLEVDKDEILARGAFCGG